MVSWVVLSNSYAELTLVSLRQSLDELYPGQFLPPREQGNFVVDGNVPGAEFRRSVSFRCRSPCQTFAGRVANLKLTSFNDFSTNS